MIQVFHGQDREGMTPCMVEFEKWWNDGGKNRGISSDLAWKIYRSGYWAGEEAGLGIAEVFA